MKKIIATILTLTLLCAACAALAEGETRYANFGEALDAAGEDAVVGGGEDYLAVIVEKDGRYLRVVTKLDDKAMEMDEAAMEAEDDMDALIQAFDDYVRTLPVSYTEEFTVQPKAQAELDALVGKTIGDLEEAGYEYAEFGTEGDENTIVFKMADGLYNYDCLVDSNFEDFTRRQENDDFDSLVIKSVTFTGASLFATDLNYHADGTVEQVENEIELDGEEMEALLTALGGLDLEEADDESGDADNAYVAASGDKENLTGDILLIEGASGEGKEDGSGLPGYEYTGEDPIEGAIADVLASEDISEQYLTEPGSVAIPCPIILKTEKADDTHVKVTGNFWVMNYVLQDKTLKCISGGECPGIITLELEDDEWIVTDLDEVGDDEDYEAGIERVAGGDKDLIAKFYEAHDMSGDPLKSIREKYIREYVEENELDVTAYQDEGWDPVELK